MADCSVHALLAAIRAKCMDCSGNMRREVERCKMKSCPLYPFRSVNAIGGNYKQTMEINGQMNLFEILAMKEKRQ